MRSKKHVAFGGAATLALAACAESLPVGSDLVDVATLPELRLVEDQRVGSRDDPDIGFTWVQEIEVTPDGRLVVLEQAAVEIRVYTPDGRLERTIGREGEGPGEFGSPGFLGLRNDTIWVTDYRERRLTLFDLEGRVLATIPAGGAEMQVRGRGMQVMPTHPLGNGRYGGTITFPHPSTFVVDSVTVPAPIFDATGAVVDTAGSLFLPPTAGGIIVQNMGVGLPFSKADWTLRFPVEEDTVVVTRPAPESEVLSTFAITRTQGGGDTVFHTRLAYEPLPFEEEHLLAGTAHRNRGFRVDPSVLAEGLREAAVETPAFHVPVTGHLVGGDGSVWLQREVTEATGARWLVIRPDGSPVGHVTVPGYRPPLWVSADAAWLLETDDLDVPWLVRMRLEG